MVGSQKADGTTTNNGLLRGVGELFDSTGAAASVIGLGFLFLSFGGEGNSFYGLATIALGSVQLFFSSPAFPASE